MGVSGTSSYGVDPHLEDYPTCSLGIPGNVIVTSDTHVLVTVSLDPTLGLYGEPHGDFQRGHGRASRLVKNS
jgi:hypothetical protein